MMSGRLFFATLLLTFSWLAVFPQGNRLATQNKKAEKLFYQALDFYQAKNYENALSDLRRATEQDPAFTEAYILQGDIHADTREFDQAIDFYLKAIRTNNPFSPNLYFILANMQLNTGRYGDAKLNYQRFLEFEGIPDPKRQQARNGIRNCSFGMWYLDHPVPFSPVNLGDSINTKYDEYINAITADGERLYFTRLNPVNAQTIDQNQNGEEDFYVSHSIDTLWSLAENLGPPINTHGNEGAISISPDGKLLFFAACNRPDGYGRCDIYWSHRTGDRWGRA